MGKWAWSLGAIAILAAIPAAAVAVGLMVLDPNAYKPTIAVAVRNATGRILDLRGPVHLSPSLWPTIEFTDVTLSNLPGGSRADIARVEKIEAQLSIPALLWHRIEVTKLTLIGPNILFEEAQGKPNWVFTPPDRVGEAAKGTVRAPFQLRIRNLHVRNGMVTWHFPARTKVVGIRSLDLRHSEDNGPLAMDATLVYSDNQPFSLRASAQPTAGFFGPWSTKLAFSAFDTIASATGTMDVAGGYDLQVEGRAGALEKLNALLPEMRLPALHHATLSTHLTNGPVPGDLPVIGATELHFDDADLGDRVQGLKLGAGDLSLPTAGGAATVTTSGQLTGRAFVLNGRFDVPLHPDAPQNVAFELNAVGAKGTGDVLGFKGTVKLDALRFGGLDAGAGFRTAALASFQPWLHRQLPKLTDVQFDGRLVVPADAGAMEFRGAKLITQQGDLAGDGTIGLGSGVMMKAKLHSETLNLDGILAAFDIDPNAPTAPSITSETVVPSIEVPWQALLGPAIDLTADIRAAKLRGQEWRDVTVALRLQDGKLDVGHLQLALPDGPLKLSLTADASAEPRPVRLEIHAPAVPLVLAARYAGLPGHVAGSLRIDTRLRTTGENLRDMARSLEGPISVSATGGELTNAAFIALTSPALDALGIRVPSEGDTKITCLGLVGSFAKGLGRFPTIALETTYLSVAGFGQVDLGKETVALKLNPLARISGSDVSVPVVVDGPFRAIESRLDANGLDKLGLLIDAWFGGDHPDTCSDAGLVAVPPHDEPSSE